MGEPVPVRKDKRSYDSSREDGWLPPSIRSAADNVISWVRRLGRWINLTECSFEAVRFDTQLMEDPDIEGEEYQHGTLFGLEIKEYLMEKFGHTCQYCGGKAAIRYWNGNTCVQRAAVVLTV